MAAAGESRQEIRGSGGSQEHDIGTVSQHSGETHASGNGPAQQPIEALKKSQEEIPGMGMAEVLAYQERLRALRLRVLQHIKEKEEKASAAEQATAAPEPRRAG